MNIKKILPFFSYLFHPIFISIYGVFIYLWLSKISLFTAETLILLIQVSILTLLLPLSIYFLMKATEAISSFTEATIRQRRIPIILQSFFLLTLIKFSGFIYQFPALYFYFMGGLIASLIAFLFSFFNFKLSLHMIGICSLLAFVISLGVYLNSTFIPIIAVLILFVGFVASSRLYLKSHNIEELVAGTIVGFFSQVILWQFYL